jgi:hypothetical protein
LLLLLLAGDRSAEVEQDVEPERDVDYPRDDQLPGFGIGDSGDMDLGFGVYRAFQL